MFSTTPTAGIIQQLNELLAHLEGVRDGSTEAVHDARVTIRRLREECLLAASRLDEDEVGRIRRQLKRAARALSQLRDADVGQRLLERAFALVPPDSTAEHLRGALIEERDASWRKAIKRLDALKLHTLPERVGRVRPHRRLLRSRGIGRTSVKRHLSRRADEVLQAIAHAGGVYFPNRLHKTRIAIKRLRYAMELADRLGGWRPPGAIGRLKQAQDVLGATHDRQVLLDRLAELRTLRDETNPPVTPIERLMYDEIHDLHEQYLALRDEIIGIAHASSARERRAARQLLLVAGLAVPSLALLRLGSTAPRPEAPGPAR